VPTRTTSAELFRDAQAILVESLWWDAGAMAMRWCDITAGVLRTSHLDGRPDESLRLPAPLASFQPAGDGVVAALADRVVLVDRAGAIVRELARVEHAADEMRFNEGKCDPTGAFVVGSMDLREPTVPDGAIYRILPDGVVGVLASGLGVANGFEWDDDWFYFTDTSVKTVYRARYGDELGAPEPFLVGHSSDGLARDVEGGFWNGLYGEGSVVHWNARGEIDLEIEIPAPNVTSVAFGGPDLSTLFVGTAREKLTEAQLEQWPLSGGIFTIETSTHGFPVRSFGTHA
jgi:sugar lactone lactonase YvrE